MGAQAAVGAPSLASEGSACRAASLSARLASECSVFWFALAG
jgi:hypothetical protein